MQVLQRTPPKDGVLAVLGDVVIETRDENAVVETDRRAETKTGIVESVTDGRVVGVELAGTECGIEISRSARASQVEDGWVDAGSGRIDPLGRPRIEFLDVGAEAFSFTFG